MSPPPSARAASSPAASPTACCTPLTRTSSGSSSRAARRRARPPFAISCAASASITLGGSAPVYGAFFASFAPLREPRGGTPTRRPRARRRSPRGSALCAVPRARRRARRRREEAPRARAGRGRRGRGAARGRPRARRRRAQPVRGRGAQPAARRAIRRAQDGRRFEALCAAYSAWGARAPEPGAPAGRARDRDVARRRRDRRGVGAAHRAVTARRRRQHGGQGARGDDPGGRGVVGAARARDVRARRPRRVLPRSRGPRRHRHDRVHDFLAGAGRGGRALARPRVAGGETRASVSYELTSQPRCACAARARARLRRAMPWAARAARVRSHRERERRPLTPTAGP